MARILYINNTGGGFADHLEVPADTTVQQFFRDRMPDSVAEDYLIRINRLPAACDQVLQDGDRVTITPLKIEGA